MVTVFQFIIYTTGHVLGRSLTYGGHKILKVETVTIGKGIKIYTLEGLTRDIMKDVELLNIKPFETKHKPKTSFPRKHRTKLYYEILKKAGKLRKHIRRLVEQCFNTF